ncbi:hypothetical protein [Stenotrophomonas sp. MMGLT7]|uniref:hypothetical protein n=1 Tax=Stenotrophomonas sp. MMGLT7 TaxID=2901227 RepID=UPI001E6451F5|nr:hypothetical protein [Stenotrophomonas sp. MMGLT7]MCD7097619.1 hypothetical protein [Stenotrophomonas sp. MMGLT7]
MPGARQHPRRSQERRRRLAHEMARLMSEAGVGDFQQAKLRAARRLGIHDDAELPRNQDIEAALREYQRLFAGPAHADFLRRRREAAGQAMAFLEAFSPRLAGPVLEGTADATSPVSLHLHSDDAEEVARFLQARHIPAQSRSRRMRLDRAHDERFPAWTFTADEVPFELVVLPFDALRQPPLSSIDGKPMQRASAAQLQRLIDEHEVPAPLGR